jgi:demethylmenaquinone methyltransferase/2-methoxy-6-polyprenyl-1,4-benzoquinol methylase
MSGIRTLFEEAAATYDRANRALTFGLDIHWRRCAARAALAGAPAAGARLLDVCTGTGDMAAALRRRLGSRGQVVGVDFCEPMLRQALGKRDARDAIYAIGAVQALPFADAAFDAATIAFAGRNLNTDRDAFMGRLREIARVLKPSGLLVVVETTRPPAAWMRAVLRLYTGVIVRYAGWALSGQRAPYGYLASTIPLFYTADEFAAILREAGFAQVRYRYLTFGVVAVHAASIHADAAR